MQKQWVEINLLNQKDFLLWTFLQKLHENSIDFNVKYKTMRAFQPILLIQSNQIDMFKTSIMNNMSRDCAKHMINMEVKKYSTRRKISHKIEHCMFLNFLGDFNN